MRPIDKTKVDAIIDGLLGNNDLTASPGVWYGLHQIKNLPVMEIVTEIVTCGECKHYKIDHPKANGFHCCYRCHNIFPMKEDDFCSRAERRTDE